MPWKIQPIRGQDYRCIFCGMQRVVFHSTFPSFLARNSLLGSIWGLLKSELRNLSTPANPYKHFRSQCIRKSFPKISKDFPKILKIHKNIWKLLLNRFRSLRKISEDFRILPKIFEDFPKILKNHKHMKITFEPFPKVFRKFPKIFRKFKKIIKT